MTGLLQPQAYLYSTTPDGQHAEDVPESALPDTSLLFNLYLQSGRLLNVYDWFEAFAASLGGEIRHEARRSTKGRKRVRQHDDDDDMEGANGSPEYIEERKMEVQARFLRSMHELDMLGLLRQTKRKADHVLRTVLEVSTDL